MKFVALVICGVAWGADWPEFRGPGAQGHSTEAGVPLEWSESRNVKWKVPVEGLGWSSPAIHGGKIWLTTAVGEGKKRTLRAMAFDKASGRRLLDIEVFKLDDAGPQHEKNSYASPTPVIEGDRVYVHYGKLGTAALLTTGEVIWRTKLEYAYQHGTGGSPVIYKDLLIVNCDGTDVQYVAALDKNTGKVKWKKDRPQPAYMAFSTPLLITVDGQDELISPGGHQTVAYDPANGKTLWFVTYGDGFSNVPRPVYANGSIFLCTGFNRASLIAVSPLGKGDITAKGINWRIDRGVSLTPSPIAVGDELYMVSDNGVLTCLDQKTGKVYYQQRLGGAYSASPVFAGGRIYFLSEEGETVVIAPGKEFKKLAVNQLEGRTLASIAVSDGAIFIRSAGNLYRIEGGN